MDGAFSGSVCGPRTSIWATAAMMPSLVLTLIDTRGSNRVPFSNLGARRPVVAGWGLTHAASLRDVFR